MLPALWLLCIWSATLVAANENAKRLYDDLMINYNKLRRPVRNPHEAVTIKLRLRLSQIIDVVSKHNLSKVGPNDVCWVDFCGIIVL